MSIARVIESIEREMFERAIKRNCGNCEWWADNQVCCCANSNETADFTSKDFFCNCHKFKENRNET